MMPDKPVRPRWSIGLSDEEYDWCQRGYFSVKAAAQFLGTSTKWVYARVHDGTLPGRRVGRIHRIPVADLERILGKSQA